MFTTLLIIIIAFLFILFLWRLLSERYALPCPTWLGWLVEQDNPLTTIHRAATIVEHAHIEPGMTVIDIGCGPGRVTIPVAKKVGSYGRVVAMDIQAGMLEKTKQKAQAVFISNITYLQAGIGQNKLEHNAYDRALLVTVLGEIPQQEKALQEIFNALKPGGVLSITETVFDPHYQRCSKVRALAHAVGFKEQQVFGGWLAYTMNLQKP